MAVTVTIAEDSEALHAHRLSGICNLLNSSVIEPLLEELNDRWDKRFMDFFMHQPGSSPWEPTGTIEFYPPPSLAAHMDRVEERFTEELQKLGLVLGPIERESYKDRPLVTRVMRVRIVENPNVVSGPPKVDMPDATGRVVLRDVLGFKPVNGQYVFAANEALVRAEKVTEEHIAKCCTSPVKETRASRLPQPKASPADASSIRRCLEELRAFCHWARTNEYERILAY